jgi:hypothetical protein
MSFKFLKVENQFLETGFQIFSTHFFRNQFFKVIAKNQFF